jgi:CSLREA domain-containing protein
VILRFTISVLLANVALVFGSVSAAYAAEIVVDTTTDNTTANDGNCTLREAINNANSDSDTTSGDCVAGDGDDTITFSLTLPSTITLVPSLDDIVIADNLAINGLGADYTIIDGGWDGSSTEIGRVFIIYHDTNDVTVDLNNLTIQHGHAEATNGGGIWNRGETLNINRCVIADNNAGVSTTNVNFGGGIYNDGGTLNIEASTFSGNYAGHRGGGIANENGGALSVMNSTFSSNISTWGAGVNLASSSATANISNSTFTGNTANNRGGGVNVYLGAITITNSTISANTGLYGAGISNNDRMTIIGSTIVSNTTSTDLNGSVYRYGGTLELINSIIVFEQNENANNCVGMITDGGYNLEYPGTSCGGFSVQADPILAPLADNGGPTLTHALYSASPAIDRIPSANCSASPVNGIDQRGAARNFDGNDLVSGECDIGAYEMRELFTQGTCGTGPLLDDQYTFGFTSGSSVRIDVDGSSNNDLRCITVEEMGPGVNHLLATESGAGSEAIQTNNWWHITGDGTDFNVSITLPYTGADADSRVCKWPGDLGGYGWDCGDGSNTSYDEINNEYVTRSNITSFSDWAVGDHVGPTAIKNASFSARSNNMSPLFVGFAALSMLLIGGYLAFKYVQNLGN